jgi:hypothetical protein
MKIIWAAIFVFLYWLGSYCVDYKHFGQYIWSDGEGYYMYLPAVLIYHTFENIPVRTKAEYIPYPNTNKILTRFTYGIALMEAPFFVGAMVSRWIQGYPIDDPFATDYSVAILLASCFYTTLGLYFLHKALLRHFTNITAWLTVGIIILGTNLLYYSIRQAGISHQYTFCLVSAVVYFLPTFYAKPSVKNTALLGFLMALIVLIRPTNILLALFVLLYNVSNKATFIERIAFFKQNIVKLGLIPLMGVLVFAPQVYYWYYLSGNPILYSYGESKFEFFSSPKFYEIFFHLCNGFIPYTPVMLFTLIGMGMIAYKNTLNGRWTLLIFSVLCYLCASWCMWWFGGTYGYRSFSDYYPLMAFGLAFYIQWLLQTRSVIMKTAQFALIAVLSFYSFRMVTFCYNFQVLPDGTDSELFLPAVKRCFWLK